MAENFAFQSKRNSFSVENFLRGEFSTWKHLAVIQRLRGNSRNFSADFSSCSANFYRVSPLIGIFSEKNEIKTFLARELSKMFLQNIFF